MKIQCNGCKVSEVKVFCCADEAALCLGCDEKIHSANKLVNKHQRVPISSSSSPMPKCDICQETSGYFICLEDRALLCRKCDVAIHTMNSYVSGHQRFLLAGVRVGLEAADLDKSSNKEKLHSLEVAGHRLTLSAETFSSVSPAAQLATASNKSGIVVEPELPLDSGIATKNAADWQFKEILELIESNPSNPTNHEGLFKAEGREISGTVPELFPHQYSVLDYITPRDADKIYIPEAGSPAVDDSQFSQNAILAKRRRRHKQKG